MQAHRVLAGVGVERDAASVQKMAEAGLVSESELSEEYIIPSMFDARVAEAVAQATREAAWASGVARKERPTADEGVAAV